MRTNLLAQKIAQMSIIKGIISSERGLTMKIAIAGTGYVGLKTFIVYDIEKHSLLIALINQFQTYIRFTLQMIDESENIFKETI